MWLSRPDGKVSSKVKGFGDRSRFGKVRFGLIEEFGRVAMRPCRERCVSGVEEANRSGLEGLAQVGRLRQEACLRPKAAARLCHLRHALEFTCQLLTGSSRTLGDMGRPSIR
jgi:hypothetical protein